MKKTTVTTIEKKEAQLNVLKTLFRQLEDLERDNSMSYECVGYEEEQAKDWRTGELKWDDDEHTVPHYDRKYDYVPIPEDQWTDDRKNVAEAINEIRTVLEKLI